jgi:hypothetical protein
MRNKLHILFFFFLLFQSSILFGKATVVQAPGIITGSVEVVAQKVTDLTSLATLLADVAFDKNARAQIVGQFKEIKDEVGADPKQFIPILGEVILTVATGNTAEQWETTVNGTADSGERTHLATRGTGNAIVTAMTGAAIIKNLPEIAEKLGENIKKVKNIKKVFASAKEMVADIVNNRNTIRKVLDTDAGEVYVRKYFDNIVKEGNFDDWYVNTFKKYDLGEPLNFEVHHVIPVNVLEGNKELQDLLFKYQDKFDFNSIENGIPVPKKSLKFDQSGHANHPDYDAAVRKRMGEILSQDIPDSSKFEEIELIVKDIKNKLENEVLLGTYDVNNIVKF